MNQIKLIDFRNKKLLLASFLTMQGVLLAPIFLLSSSQVIAKEENNTQEDEKENPDKKNGDHTIKDTLRKVGEKTAAVVSEGLTRARKGIHAATEDLEEKKNKENAQALEDKASHLYEKGKDKTKEKAKSIKHKTEDAYEEGKKGIEKAAKSVKDKASHLYEKGQDKLKEKEDNS